MPTLFADRILPFDTNAACRYADLAVKTRAAGRGFPTPDGDIAEIAALRDFAVASRDTSAFIAAGLRVIDPLTATAYPVARPCKNIAAQATVSIKQLQARPKCP